MTSPAKYTILCDVDGVLADLATCLCDELTLRGMRLSPSDIRHYDFKLSMPPDVVAEAYDVMGDYGFCHSLFWYEGARKFVFDFVHGRYSSDFEMLLVTAPFPSETWVQERKAWATASGIRGCDVLSIPIEHKYRLRGDCLVEDHPGTLYDWLEANPNGHGVLVDRPWNQRTAAEFKFHNRAFRAKTHDEVAKYVNAFRATGRASVDYRSIDESPEVAA